MYQRGAANFCEKEGVETEWRQTGTQGNVGDAGASMRGELAQTLVRLV